MLLSTSHPTSWVLSTGNFDTARSLNPLHTQVRSVRRLLFVSCPERLRSESWTTPNDRYQGLQLFLSLLIVAFCLCALMATRSRRPWTICDGSSDIVVEACSALFSRPRGLSRRALRCIPRRDVYRMSHQAMWTPINVELSQSLPTPTYRLAELPRKRRILEVWQAASSRGAG